ncbi:hypothetical protein [Streptomyces sp. XD-27]|uniref:hypothetical protein n=1 Tax=Streptomyces sp. XD-27 TaxID=3062779 RepID=UPI0026F43B28|nr:hypothetical protein [Streptomyces sp. XD-27]WKX69127.1 hypothetical protein Q3Y56_03615 [Streptomyces sp. XD-27]
MVTARPTSSLLRTRPTSAGPVRALWLAALLLGLLYTHGLSGESVAGHMTAGSSVTAAAPVHTAHARADGGGTAVAAAADHAEPRLGPGHHDHGEPGHAELDCLSGKPQHGIDLPTPCAAPPAAVPSAPVHRGAVTRRGPAETPPPPVGDPAILRI